MSEGIIIIKKGREKPVINQHPWIFSGAIAKALNAEDGELVTVVDSNNNFLARGYWNSQSQIQVRILTWHDEAIDDAWWANKFEQAVKLRSVLRVYSEDNQQVACRIVNAENDFLPGLIIDQYADWYVLQALTLYIDNNKQKLAEIFAGVVGATQIYERSDVDVRQREGLPESTGLLIGDTAPDAVDIIESDTQYTVNIRDGHKTGFYLDQRENRDELEGIVAFYADTATDVDEIQLLNLFSYTGGFAMSAHNVGVPLHSVSVDASYEALELAEANYNLNAFDENPAQSAEFIQADCFDYLHHCVDEGKTFDIVILDPPKFAHNKRQIDRASRGYKDLNLNAFKIINSGGYLMTFSCSGAISRDLFQKIVFGALADSGRQAQIIRHLSAGDDHPIALTFPEGEYLKGLLLRVF
jgi:23S rRNA (cytosine1962-C5)-methyltransferase